MQRHLRCNIPEDGMRCQKWMKGQHMMTTNNHYRADALTCDFALNANPEMQSTWDDAPDPISIEFHVCFLPPGAPEGSGPWVCIFVGEGLP